jgi:hypothetical protein
LHVPSSNTVGTLKIPQNDPNDVTR